MTKRLTNFNLIKKLLVGLVFMFICTIGIFNNPTDVQATTKNKTFYVYSKCKVSISTKISDDHANWTADDWNNRGLGSITWNNGVWNGSEYVYTVTMKDCIITKYTPYLRVKASSTAKYRPTGIAKIEDGDAGITSGGGSSVHKLSETHTNDYMEIYIGLSFTAKSFRCNYDIYNQLKFTYDTNAVKSITYKYADGTVNSSGWFKNGTTGYSYITLKTGYHFVRYEGSQWNGTAGGSWDGCKDKTSHTTDWSMYANRTINIVTAKDKKTLTFVKTKGVKSVPTTQTAYYGDTLWSTVEAEPGYHLAYMDGTKADGSSGGYWDGCKGKTSHTTDWSMYANRTITVHAAPNTYYFDVNTCLDGNVSYQGYDDIRYNVYMNNQLVAKNVRDYNGYPEYGTSYKIEMIGNSKYRYSQATYEGTVGGETSVMVFAYTRYSFDVNTVLNGTQCNTGYDGIRYNVYINGQKVAENVSDYCDTYSWAYGDTYDVEMYSSNDYQYTQWHYTGTIYRDTEVLVQATSWQTMTVKHYKYNHRNDSWDYFTTTNDRVLWGSTYTPPYSQTPTGYYNHHRDWDGGWTVTGDGTFSVYYYPNSYPLDVNPILNGIQDNCGYSELRFNVYINDALVAENVFDYCQDNLYGDVYRVELISNPKYTYDKKDYTGTVTGTTYVEPRWQSVPIVERVTTVQDGNDSFYAYAYVTNKCTYNEGPINRVVFPNWTAENGQDDLKAPYTQVELGTKGNWTINGKIYNYVRHINSADHKRTGTDEHNWYNVHVYGFNDYGGAGFGGTTFSFKYEITFNYNKPSNASSVMTGNTITSKIVTYNTKYGTLPSPSMRGYTFNGWYTAQTGGTKITADSVNLTPRPQTLYAHWSANIYTITLDSKLDGHTGDNGTTTIYEKFDAGFYADKSCTKQISSITPPKKIGNKYNGYYDGNTIIIKPDGTIAVKNNYFATDKTIIAHWNTITYTIIFNGNRNDGGNTANMTYTWHDNDNGKFALNTNKFTRTGWQSTTRWNTRTNSGGTAYNDGQVIGNQFFIDNLGLNALKDGNSHTVTLFATWRDVVTPKIKSVKIEQQTLLSEANKGTITLNHQKAYEGDLFTYMTVVVNENNANTDASGIKEVKVYVYDKDNKAINKTYDITSNITSATNTKYDYYYNGIKYPYQGTYTFKQNLYTEFPNSARLGIYVYVTDYQGNTTKTAARWNKISNDTISKKDVPQDKPLTIKDDNTTIEDIVLDEINVSIYSDYLTADGSNDFSAGETGITTVWTYGYAESYSLDYLTINAEMDREINDNLLSEENRMNRSKVIGRDEQGKALLSSVDTQAVRIPPYVLKNLSTITSGAHTDGTGVYKDMLNNKYNATAYKGKGQSGIYNLYNITDSDYQAVHYRSGV